jgi:diguanylate cyclase (GGDEF)-like protein/PAS domain S-box-containing protein
MFTGQLQHCICAQHNIFYTNIDMTFSHKLRSTIGYLLLLLVVAVIGATGAITYENLISFITLANDRSPAQQTLSTIDSVLSRLDEIEAVETDTTVVSQEPSLTRYRQAIKELSQQTNAITALMADQPGRLSMITALGPLINQRVALSEQFIAALQDGRLETADKLLSTGMTGQLTAEIRHILEVIKESEIASIDHYTSSVLQKKRNAVFTIVAGNVIAIIIVLAYFLYVRKQIALRKNDRETLKKLLITVEQSSDLIVVTDKTGTIEYVNKAVEDVSGYASEELLGKNRDIWKSGKHAEKFFTEMQDTVFAGLPFSGLAIYRAKNGKLFYLEETVTPFRDEGSITHLISTGKDVTHQKNLKEKVNYLSHYDVLTGMPNRVLFSDLLEQGIRKARQNKSLIAVLAVDIDRFKLVNDAFGFSAGNDILRAITERLTDTVAGGGSVARIGSDEFGIALYNMVGVPDISSAVERIMRNVRQPIMLRGEELVLSLAVGVSVYPDDAESVEKLLGNAHIALSKAKSEGRNNYQFFTRHITKKASEGMLMEKRLSSALKKEEYLVYYQPYLDMITRRVGGVEALIKWKSDRHGMVAPSKFIPLLEDSGMIIDVGEWVLRTACRQIKQWNWEPAKFPVAVNLSLMQLRHRDVIDMVERTVREFDIDPSRLILEVTEGMCIYDLDFASIILKKLKNIGVSISIDDFGTGYSSLSYLKKLPVDNVKIDMSFVKDITVDPDAASIVSAITTLARNLNLKTIAEGVETEDQWKILRLLRCDMAQGFLFSPALPAMEISKLVTKDR